MSSLFFRWSIKTRLIAGFAAVTMIFAGVALYNSSQLAAIQKGTSEERQKTELQLNALEMKGTAQDVKDIASGLMISRKTEFVEKYKAARPIFQEAVKKIADTAVTDDEMKWRSQLIMASTDYLNMFDQAVQIISDPNLKEIDIRNNTQYLYDETQNKRDSIFQLVDKFYASYSQAAEDAVRMQKQRVDRTRTIVNWAAWLTVVLSAAVAFLIIWSFNRQILRLQNAVAVMAGGDLSHKINASSRDELGKLSWEFDRMVDHVSGMLARTQTIASSLSVQSGRFQRFSQDTAEANANILRTIHEIASGADQQALHAEESSSMLEELDQEMAVIWGSAGEMKAASSEAGQATLEGQRSLESLRSASEDTARTVGLIRDAIRELQDSSAHIGKIVNTITEISAQTNILSLNAAIEAARAGAAGRGFSVIAEEVRMLSQETNDSSKDIAQSLGGLQSRIGALAEAVGQTREVLENQDGQVRNTMDSFRSIEASIHGVTERIEGIYAQLEKAKARNRSLVQSVQHVAAVAEETAAGVQEVTSTSVEQDASVRSVAEQAREIGRYSEELFREISRFKLEDAG